MLKELKVRQDEPSCVYVDNESAKKLAKNPQFHNRTKHIDVRHHFVRERIEMKQIEVEHVPAFEKHRAAMRLISREEFEKKTHNHVDH
ncbi:Glucan endo-1,3-beta-glucosidase [Phytophthora megakarya]|uniref:Glucan endo-1,3-beta-glucosidase n=1 Tax=Phytophthora megakarya TaxID=4795 RepID=A0A225WAU9_9STRA|nr:Glucan endo-1,3-beta-glucosidase [Phytophthora megakarya]